VEECVILTKLHYAIHREACRGVLHPHFIARIAGARRPSGADGDRGLPSSGSGPPRRLAAWVAVAAGPTIPTTSRRPNARIVNLAALMTSSLFV
jgi:hypothetical protein